MKRYNAYANAIKIASILFDSTLNKRTTSNAISIKFFVLLGDSDVTVTD